MARKSGYDGLVKPHLEEIKEWMKTYSEGQIAKKLGVSPHTFVRYKKLHKELEEAVQDGMKSLKEELKASMKKRALGYYYEETERKVTTIGDKTEIVEKTTRRYSHPDVGAMHLLLKNLDPDWHNDDYATLKQKAKQLELDERRVKNNEF